MFTKSRQGGTRAKSAVLTAAMLLACVGPVFAPAYANDKVVLAINAVSGGGDSALIGSYLGYFADEGIDIQFMKVANPNLGTTALVSGSADLGTFAPSASFFNVAVNSDLVVVAGNTYVKPGYGGGSDIMASNAAYAAGLRGPADLRGKKVATTGSGGYIQYSLYQLATKYHVPFNTITLSMLGSDPNVLAAIKTGAIDAGTVPYALSPAAEKEGDGKVIARLSEEVPTVTSVLLSTHKIVANRRDALVRFMRAYLRSAAFYADTFEKRDASGNFAHNPQVDGLLDRLAKDKGIPVEALAKGMIYIQPHAELDPADIASYLAAWKALGLVDANLDGSKLVDLSAYDEARGK